MMKSYSIEYAGQVEVNRSLPDVVAGFAELSKLPEETSKRFVTSTKKRTIKKNLTLNEAERYRKKLNSIGLQIRIVETDENREKPPVQVPKPRKPRMKSKADNKLNININFAKLWAFQIVLSIIAAAVAGGIIGFFLGIISILAGLPKDYLEMMTMVFGFPIGLYASFYYYRWSIKKYILPQVS